MAYQNKAYKNKVVAAFDKGIVTEIGDEKIPYGSAADNNNWLDLGDRIELVRGQKLIGTEETGTGRVTGLTTVADIDGTEYMYRVKDTDLQIYNSTTEDWDDVKTDMPDDEDVAFTKYRPPAGSFLIFSGKSDDMGLWRINMANTTSVVDLYTVGTNYKGFPTIEDNRMWLWNIKGAENIVRLSWIDNDWPYTNVSGENWGTGAPPQVTFTGTATNPLIAGNTISITDSVETFTDDGNGNLTGDAGGTGTINYTTGGYSVTFNTAPTGGQAITADYDYEDPDSKGVFDFTYSSPARKAGEGNFFWQAQSDDQIQNVIPFDEKFYCLHDKSIWVIDLTSDDTNATNKVFRVGTGIPNWRAVVPTGEGIYYVDAIDDENKVIRKLRYNDLSSKFEPISISDSLDLTNYIFDDSAGIEFGDYIIFACKSSSNVSYNDTLLLYNKKWDLWDKMSGLYRCFTIYNGALYGGSSVTDNVYQIFSGFDDDDSIIEGIWTANDADLDQEELKKCKKFTIEGEMQTSQEIQVEVNFDQAGWQEVGSITGASDYVDKTSTYTYGTVMYGTEDYGTGDYVIAHRYMREFKFDSVKFDRIQIRIKNKGLGYLNVREYKFKDIRLKGHKLPARFR